MPQAQEREGAKYAFKLVVFRAQSDQKEKVDCFIFWAVFGCCAHTGQNMLFQKILHKKAGENKEKRKKQENLPKIQQKAFFLNCGHRVCQPCILHS